VSFDAPAAKGHRAQSDVSWWLLCAGTTSITWMGLRVTANTTLSDILLIVSVLCAGPQVVYRSILKIPSVVVLPIAVLLLLEVLGMRDQPSRFMGVRMSVALLLCILATMPVAHDVDRRRTLTHLYCYGAAASGAVATLSRVTGVYFRPPGLLPEFPGREVGLTLHPNHLGLTCLLGLAAAAFSGVAAGQRLLRAGVLLALAGGVVVSGSRASLLGAFAVGLAALWTSSRKRRPELIAGLLFAASVGVVFGTGSIVRLSALDRLFSVSNEASLNVAVSDSERLSYALESLDVFARSPIIGSGLDQLRLAHNLYLQVIACGGILLLLALLPMFVRVLGVGRHHFSGRIDPNAASVAAWLVAALFMNSIFDRYLYLLFALALFGPYWGSSIRASVTEDGGRIDNRHGALAGGFA